VHRLHRPQHDPRRRQHLAAERREAPDRLHTRAAAAQAVRAGRSRRHAADRGRVDVRALTALRREAMARYAPVPRGAPNKNLVLAAMVFAVAMTFIDQTIVAIAIPSLRRELGLTATG